MEKMELYREYLQSLFAALFENKRLFIQVRVPIEDSAYGKVLIEKVKLDEEVIYDVILEFKEGKLINSSHKEVMDFVHQFPGDSDKIAEFGIGLNENINETIGYSLIDEKCKGTVHIAIGMNNIFGGKNQSPLHYDFVFTPNVIKFDNEVFEIV